MTPTETLPTNVEPASTWRDGQPFRARKSVEHTIAGAGYMIRSASRRPDLDVPNLAHLVELSDVLDVALHDAVNTLRARGHSFTEVGAALGITRQAARQRFG